MIVGSSVLALENTAQLCYKVAVDTSHQQWGRFLVPHPSAVDIVIYMEFSSPNKCGVIPHGFLSVFLVQFSSVQLLSHVCLFATPWTAAGQASLSITNSQSLLNSCPSNQWCHQPSHPVIPFSSHLQSFPASGSFQKSQLFASGGQRFGASASASILPMTIQDWFPLGMTGWISLQSKGLSRVFSNTTVQKHQFFGSQLSLWPNSHIHTWLLEKP